MTMDNEQYAPELLARNGRVTEPGNVRLTAIRPDRAGGEPQLDYVGDGNPLHVTLGDVQLSPYFNSALSTTLSVVKNGPTYLGAIEASNINAADAFIQLFAAEGQVVTLGTTTPLLSFFVPAGDGANRGAMDKVFATPLIFPNGLQIAATTTATGSSAPSTGLVVNVGVR